MRTRNRPASFYPQSSAYSAILCREEVSNRLPPSSIGKGRSRQRRNHRVSYYGNSRVLPTCGAFSEIVKRTFGESVVAEMGAVHKLPPAERVARVKADH